jgi:hypothetical protein
MISANHIATFLRRSIHCVRKMVSAIVSRPVLRRSARILYRPPTDYLEILLHHSPKSIAFRAPQDKGAAANSFVWDGAFQKEHEVTLLAGFLAGENFDCKNGTLHVQNHSPMKKALMRSSGIYHSPPTHDLFLNRSS